MAALSRRQLLRGIAGGTAVSLAGCSDGDEPEPGLHATTAIVLHRPGDDRYRYPQDVAVRVVVENTDLDRRTGTLVVRLRPAGADASTEEWSSERPVELAGGTTRSYVVVFEDVAESGADEFDASATVEPAG